MSNWSILKVALLATMMLVVVSNIHPVKIVDSSVLPQEQADASPFLSINDSDGSLVLDGQEFHAVGANHADLIWSFINESYVRGEDNSTKVIEEAAEHGIRVIRFSAIGCGPWAKPFIELWYNSNTRATFWAGYDNMVGNASENGVYLVPSFVWTMPIFELFSYMANYNGTDYNETVEQIQRLFEPGSNESKVLREFVGDMVTRYKDNSTILMWEIGNELDLTCNNTLSKPNENYTTIPILRAFLNETANYIHNLDPNHLVESGMQKVPHGYPDQNLSDATSAFITFYNEINVDVTSLHVYIYGEPEKLYGPVYEESTRTYIASFLDASRVNLCKPLIIGEFGERGNGSSAPDDSSFILSILETTLRYEVPLSMVWEWMVPDGRWLDVENRSKFNISPESTLNTTSTPNLVSKLEIYSRLVSATNNTFNVTHDGEAVSILIHSNSTIQGFDYNDTLKQIAFNVTETSDNTGFCRIAIPTAITQEVFNGNLTVLVDGNKPSEVVNWTTEDYPDILSYFTYNHSLPHRITIIPELGLMLISTFMAASLLVAYQKAPKRKQKQKQR